MDKRVIERQIRKGKLDASAHKRTLEALPDVSDRVARDDVAAVLAAVLHEPRSAGAVLYVVAGEHPIEQVLADALG